MNARLALILALFACSLRAADAPVPVVDEPMHKTVFENAHLRILDVQIPPGETSLYHCHEIPSVVVYLTKSTNRSESWPEGASLNRDVLPGQSRYAAYDWKPLTHRVTNTGAKLFRVFDIELLKKTRTSEPLQPRSLPHVTPQWEESLARSSSVQLARGEKAAIPASRLAVLVIAIKGALETRTSGSSTARTLKWGEYQFFPAQTRLELAPAGSEDAEAIVLELSG